MSSLEVPSGGRLVNFRDLGGVPLVSGRTFPKGRLYRGGTFQFLTPDQTAELASKLGLRMVINLRTVSERGEGASRFPPHVNMLHIPFLTHIDPAWERPIDQSPGAVASRYVDMLDRQGYEAVAPIVRAVKSKHLPMVVHCLAGRDRTGIVVAILLALAGVTDNVIAADYAMSGPALRQLSTDPAMTGFIKPDPPDEFDTSPETMLLLLELIRHRYGSPEGLVVRSGGKADDIDRFRSTILATR